MTRANDFVQPVVPIASRSALACLDDSLRARARIGALAPRSAFRFQAEAQAMTTTDATRIFGTCVKYGVVSQVRGDHQEVFGVGCFDQSLADRESDPLVLFNHNCGHVLGRRSSNTARFFPLPDRIDFEVDVPECVWALDLCESIERGDINQAGVGFIPELVHWTSINGERVLVIERAQLIEASVVSFSPYPQTSASLEAGRMALMGRRLECMRSIGGIQ